MPKTFYFQNINSYQSHEIFNGFTVGRSDEANITISDEKISSKHLILTTKEETLFIEDLGTSNGTQVNGNQIVSNTPIKVKLSDRVKIGSVTLVVSHDEEFDFANLKGEERGGREFEIFQGEIDIQLGNNTEFLVHNDVEPHQPKKEIEKIKGKIKTLHKKIEHLETQVNERNELCENLSDVKKEHKLLLQEAPFLETAYKEHKEFWDGINLVIANLERELNLEKNKKDEIAPAMRKYEEFLVVDKICRGITKKIDDLSRKNLDDKILGYRKAITEGKNEILKNENKIEQITREKEKIKEKQKDHIRDEIKRLQAKLDKVK